MRKTNAEEELAWKRHTSQSGTHRSMPAGASVSERPQGAESQDSSVMGVQSDVWERLAFWIARLPEDDPRLKLLQLAQLRRDVKLADAVLRNL
jgi:hypothetical protein